MRRLGIFFVVLMVMAGGFNAKAYAFGGSPWVSSDYVQARLLNALSRFGPRESFPAALNIKLEEGWHAYWRMPGDAGLPPVLDWGGSQNLVKAEMDWPVPKRFDEAGLNSFGYEGSVLFPLTLYPETADLPMELRLNLEIMVCKDICIPQTISLSYDIPAGFDEQSETAPVIAHAFTRLPHKEDMAGLRIDNLVVGPDALAAIVWSDEGFDGFDLFVETGKEEAILSALPDIVIDEKEPRKATISVVAPEGMDNLATLLYGADVTLTFAVGKKAIEKKFSL